MILCYNVVREHKKGYMIICENCGTNKNLVWHHTHPDSKERSTGNERFNKNNMVMYERMKCILLCRQCHYRLHKEINQDYLTNTQALKEFRQIIVEVLKRIYKSNKNNT